MNPPGFRRSIWDHNTEYDFDPTDISKDDAIEVARLASVDAAKLQTPPVSIRGLLEVSKAAHAVPEIPTIEDIKDYLETTLTRHGIGLPKAICMLAASNRRSQLPPMDRKFAKGLVRHRAINNHQFKSLTPNSASKAAIQGFADVYFNDVVSFWRELRKTKGEKEADHFVSFEPPTPPETCRSR